VAQIWHKTQEILEFIVEKNGRAEREGFEDAKKEDVE
jgi:hypothetical protein